MPDSSGDDLTSDYFDRYSDEQHADRAGGWLHWWHWLVLVAIFFAGLVFVPLWRFDQRYAQLQVGDSFERVKELLGEPDEAAFTVIGAGTSDKGYVYTRYWRTYEITVSTLTGRVVAKAELGEPSDSAGTPASPASP